VSADLFIRFKVVVLKKGTDHAGSKKSEKKEGEEREKRKTEPKREQIFSLQKGNKKKKKELLCSVSLLM